MSDNPTSDEEILSNFIVPDGEGEENVEESSEEELNKIADLIKMNPFESMCNVVNVFFKAWKQLEQKNMRKRKSNEGEEAPSNNEPCTLESIITDVHKEDVAIWYEDLKMSAFFCFNVMKKCYVKTCQCFSSLDPDEAVNLLVYLSQLEHGKQEKIYKQFLSASDKKNKAIVNIHHLEIFNKTFCCTSLRNLLVYSTKSIS
ncbi:hypothetical protein ACA910_000430 [Epithemia clementina (nom. ined.)]